jgi:endonuclease/exonuclease/phosphatase (EEP) superfamily protein YafD
LPSPAPPLASASSSLTLFNYNVLGFEDLSSRVVQEISSLQPDVVTLQEVNPELAKALQDNLRSKYPCQLLDPKEGSWGMGTLSKFPCAELPAPQRGLWVGKPQITKITLPQNNELVIANIHAIHPHVALQRGAGAFGWLRMTDTIRNREETIKTLLNELRATDISNVIIAGDLNASMRNKIYQTVLNSGFVDSWLELYPASSGGTWPVPGIAGTSFLSGTLRIDFIFRSRTLRTKSIELLSESIGSDHRGMFAAFDVQ